MAISERMLSLLGEESEDIEMKSALPQLVLAMQSMGLDPSDDAAQDQFISFLKKLTTNKNALKRAMGKFSGNVAAKAMKVAKGSM